MKGKTNTADPELLERAVLTQKVELMQSLLDDAKARELKLRTSYQKMVDWIHADGTTKPPILSSLLCSSVDGKSVEHKIEPKQAISRMGTPKKAKKSSKKHSASKLLADETAEEKPSNTKIPKRRRSGVSNTSAALGYQSGGYPYNNCHLSCHLGGLSFGAVANCDHLPQSVNNLSTGTVFKKKPTRNLRNQGPLIDDSIMSLQQSNNTSPILAAIENKQPKADKCAKPTPRVIVALRKDAKENMAGFGQKMVLNPHLKHIKSVTQLPEGPGDESARTTYQLSQTEPSVAAKPYYNPQQVGNISANLTPAGQRRSATKLDHKAGSPPQGSGRSVDISATNGSVTSYCLPAPLVANTPGSSHRRVNSSQSMLQAMLSKQNGQFICSPREQLVSPAAAITKGSFSGKALGHPTALRTVNGTVLQNSRDGIPVIPSVPVESILLNTPINIQPKPAVNGQIPKRESAQSQSKYIMAQSFHLNKPTPSNGTRTPGTSNSFVLGPPHNKMLSTLIGTNCSTEGMPSHIAAHSRVGLGALKQHTILSQSRDHTAKSMTPQVCIGPAVVSGLQSGMPAISINLSAQDRDLSSIHIDASDPGNVQIHLKRDHPQSQSTDKGSNLSATRGSKTNPLQKKPKEELGCLLLQQPRTNTHQSGSTLATRPSAAGPKQSGSRTQNLKGSADSGAPISGAYNLGFPRPEAAAPASILKPQFHSVQITRPDRDSTKIEQRELDSSIVEESSAYTRSEYEHVQGVLNNKWTNLQEKYLCRLR